MNKTTQDQNVEILEMKSLRNRTETIEFNFTNRIQQMEAVILEVENKTFEIDFFWLKMVNLKVC